MKAVRVVLANEGDILVQDPRDPGGLTKYGISSRAHPDVNVARLTERDALEIYYYVYWRPHRYGELTEPVSIKVFDFAVNMGPHGAVICLQRALRACGRRVKEDGKLGPKTIGAEHAVSNATLIPSLRSEGAGRYRLIAAKHPDHPFLEGWLRRAYED